MRFCKRLDFRMPSRWVRLVACVALAAFLVANGTAFAHHSLPSSGCRCGDASCSPSDGTSTVNTPSSTCQHCRAKQKRQIAFGSSQRNDDRRQLSPSSPACPCEHPNPSKPSCPCPGGCMFCSVAKVPCAAPIILSPKPASCLGYCLSELPLLYAPLFCGKLIRPPRA